MAGGLTFNQVRAGSIPVRVTKAKGSHLIFSGFVGRHIKPQAPNIYKILAITIDLHYVNG